MTLHNIEFFQAYRDIIAQKSFYEAYDQAFEVIEADTPELKQKAFELRYNVYCQENQFPEFHKNPEKLEHDIYDARAIHHLLLHRESGQVAGVIRVLLPDMTNLLDSFSLQAYGNHPILKMTDQIGEMCEISHFCVSKQFRRRAEDGNVLPGYSAQDDSTKSLKDKLTGTRRRIPYAPLGLLRAAFETALNNRVTDCLMLVESSHLPALEKIGMTYRTLGPHLELQGRSQPIVFNIKNMLDSMRFHEPNCWDVVTDKGRLDQKASLIQTQKWQDKIFDPVCRQEIMDLLLESA